MTSLVPRVTSDVDAVTSFVPGLPSDVKAG
jgi:hypothetical protein